MYHLPFVILWVVEASFPNIGVTTTLSAWASGQLLLNHLIFQSGFQCPIRYGIPNVRMDMIWVITVLGRWRLKPLHSNSFSSPRFIIARSILNLLLIFHTLAIYPCQLSNFNAIENNNNGPATEIFRPFCLILKYLV